VSILRRVLYLDALVTGLTGALLALVPAFLIETLFGQPRSPDDEVLRLLGVALITASLLMVLVGHRVEDVWWWCWAFVFFEAAAALVSLLNAALGVPSGAPAWPWWTLGLVSLGFASAFVWGIGRAGMEPPPQ
jgi:hypothetical protein